MALDDQTLTDTGSLSLTPFEALAEQKVQLDIDDAPFLQDPEDEPSLPVPADGELAVPEEEETTSPNKKKRIILVALLLLLLGGGGFLVYKLFFAPTGPQAPIIIIPTHIPEESLMPEFFQVEFEPFLVEVKDEEGKRHFLRAGFTLQTDDPMAYLEILDKIMPIRDAIYYHLTLYNYDVLSLPAYAERRREDLLKLVNDTIIQGKASDILFNTYLIMR